MQKTNTPPCQVIITPFLFPSFTTTRDVDYYQKMSPTVPLFLFVFPGLALPYPLSIAILKTSQSIFPVLNMKISHWVMEDLLFLSGYFQLYEGFAITSDCVQSAPGK